VDFSQKHLKSHFKGLSLCTLIHFADFLPVFAGSTDIRSRKSDLIL